MKATKLHERCTANTNIGEDTFVGFKCVDGNIFVHFPLGFRPSEDEKSLKKDILLLISTLEKNTDKTESEINKKMDFQSVSLPIQAYLYVIADYFNHGYYKETENTYVVAKQGRINWGRTIKTQRAYLQGSDAFYLDFVTKKKNINDNEIITLIHEYCVYESFAKMGWLFSSYVPKAPNIKFNKVRFIGAIKRKLAETFNDRKKELLSYMLAIVKSLGNDGGVKDYKYGTNRFEYVWESLVDKVYGIKNKKDYFPKTKWILNDIEYDNDYENNKLKPDSIMILDNKIYVLDAKYYKFGWSGQPSHLPESTSINKQITYGEYIAENKKFKNKDGENPTVYNAFIMPYNSSDNTFKTENEIHYIGNAISDWKGFNHGKKYEKVAGILIDVKSLMKSDAKDQDKIIALAGLIEESIN